MMPSNPLLQWEWAGRCVEVCVGDKMWYEIVPSFAIITVALAVPGVIKYFGHQLIFGNAYIRDKTQRWDRFMYQRDERLTGDPYKPNGLEAIPDE